MRGPSRLDRACTSTVASGPEPGRGTALAGF
jgi:hypothetical protein